MPPLEKTFNRPAAMPPLRQGAAGAIGWTLALVRTLFWQPRALPAPAASKPKDNVPHGILCMIGATVLFALSSALAKWLVAIYPVGEVMFFRSFFSLVVCAAVILPFTGLAV